jgi:hypothetical protein
MSKLTRSDLRALIRATLSESFMRDQLFRYSEKDMHAILVSQIRDVVREQSRRGHSQEKIFRAMKEVFAGMVEDMKSEQELDKEVS